MRIPGSDLVYFHFYILIFPFFFLDVPFLQKRATQKTWLESSVFGIEKRPKFGCLIFEFQISTSVHMVRVVGLEPTRIAPQEPKSCASANSAIPASVYIILFSRPHVNRLDFIPSLGYAKKHKMSGGDKTCLVFSQTVSLCLSAAL